MNISGLITIFPKMRGKFKFFEGTISGKDEDDKFVNTSVECKFGNKDNFDQKFIDSLDTNKYYIVDIYRGFLSVDQWEDNTTHDTRKKLVIIITDCKIKSSGTLAKSKAKK